MNATIIATGVSHGNEATSSIELAAIAGKRCIEQAGIDVQEIDYLFNVGIYRDSNMVEPSMAALIQKKVGLNRDFIRFPVKSPAFSTDLMNGAAGVINACHVADALLKAGLGRYVLVVSSDIHPSGKSVDGFPITPSGSAILLGPGQGNRGFLRFSFQHSDDDDIGESSYIDFEKCGLEGRTNIIVDRNSDYCSRLLTFTGQAAKKFISDNRIETRNTILLAPAYNESFSTDLAAILNFSPRDIIDLWPECGNPHTSTIGIALDTLLKRGDFKNHKQLLLVGAGAGLHAGLALYQV